MRIPEPLLTTQALRTVHGPRLMRKALKELAHEAHPIVTMDVNPVQGPEIRGGLRVLLEELI